MDHLIQISIATGILYCTYRYLLFHPRQFSSSRIYLLLAPVLSGAACFSKLQLFSTTQFAGTISTYMSAGPPDATSRPLNIESLLLLYYAGVVLASLRFLYGLIRIFLLRRKAVKTQGFLRLEGSDTPAFSFFHWIFISGSVDPDTRNTLLAHERVHVSQWHSLDLIYYELFRIVFWFNPFSHLLHRELKTVHEFIADAHAVKHSRTPEHYCELLVTMSLQPASYPPSNHFSEKGLLHKRVERILNRKKNSAGRYLFLLPSLLLILTLNTLFSADLMTSAGTAAPYGETYPSYLAPPAGSDTLTTIVRVKFRVGKNGEALSPKVISSTQEPYNSEAIQQILSSEDWRTYKGAKVGKELRVSVSFTEINTPPQ